MHHISLVTKREPRLRGEPTKKERTHERIVKSAAEALRKNGFDALSVGEVMKDAGLTHGGFYAHFPSREALLREALETATEDGLASLRANIGGDTAGGLAELVQSYLSDAHVQHPEVGCALAALGSEARRQPKALRKVATAGTERMLALIESRLPPPDRTRRERAMVVLSALVGALVLSRASSDADLSRSLRDAVSRAVVTGG